MKMLGHTNIKNMLIYMHLVDSFDDDSISRVAKTIEETCKWTPALNTHTKWILSRSSGGANSGRQNVGGLFKSAGGGI